MLKKGSNNIEKELNIAKIIKDLKNLQILMRSKLADNLVKKEIEHNKKNVINLDEDKSSS